MNSSRRGIALVIAISNYKHQEKLGNAINDANEMTRKLNECNYEVIEAINEEIDGIQSALHKVRIRISVNSYPEVVIYYAGHGLVNDDSLYILGSEYEDGLNQLVLNGLSVEKVIERICEISIAEDKKRSIVVILDTCRKPAAPGPPLRAGQSASSDFVESHARLILKNKTRIGILVCYACAQGRGARDYGNHGLYTKFVLEECFKSNMSIINALGNANEKVYQMTNLSQKPQLAVNFPHYFTFSLGVPQDEEKSEASSNNRVAELSTRLSLQILQEEKLMPPHSSSVDIRSVDIPLVEDMPLEEEWEYISNRNGPAIHAKKDFLLISRSEGTSNQWSYLFLEHAFPVDNWGYTISFDIRYDIIQVKIVIEQ